MSRSTLPLPAPPPPTRHLPQQMVRGHALYRLYLGIADGVSIAHAHTRAMDTYHTGTPIPAQWTLLRQRRDKADIHTPHLHGACPNRWCVGMCNRHLVKTWCMDMCVDTCVRICAGMCTDVCVGMCTDVYEHVCRHVYGHMPSAMRTTLRGLA